MEQAVRSSGQYGPRVEVPGDTDTQTRLLGFLGRDPSGRAAEPARPCRLPGQPEARMASASAAMAPSIAVSLIVP